MLLHKGGLSREGTLIHFHIKTLGEEKQVSEGEVFYRQDTDNVIMSHLDENTTGKALPYLNCATSPTTSSANGSSSVRPSRRTENLDWRIRSQ